MQKKQKIKQKILDKIRDKTFKPKIAQQALKVSEKTIYKHLRNLIKEGLVIKKGWGEYEIQGGGEVSMDTHESPLKHGYRLHAIMAYYSVPLGFDLKRWGKNRGRFLSSKGVAYKKQQLSNRAGLTDTLYFFTIDDRFKCFATKNGVMVYVPSIERVDEEEVYVELASSLLAVGDRLNVLFGRLFYKPSSWWQVSVRRAELSHVNNGIAKHHVFEESRLKVFLGGVERLRVDVSGGLPELEMPSVVWQEQDARTLIEVWYRDMLKEGNLLMPPSRVRYEFGMVTEMLVEQQKLIANLTMLLYQHINKT